jgi:hypothetical protein
MLSLFIAYSIPTIAILESKLILSTLMVSSADDEDRRMKRQWNERNMVSSRAV